MPHQSHRSRSRSPTHQHRSSLHRHRSRSPHESRHQTSKSRNSPRTTKLPLNAQPLSKHDLRTYRPMFGLYLDIQKQKDIEDMDEDEVKGRWKSFVGKWNRGELAEGWYDPKTLEKAIAAESNATFNERGPVQEHNRTNKHEGYKTHDEEDGEDDYGPSLPTRLSTDFERDNHTHNHQASGPSIPSLDDLRARNEQTREESDAQYEERIRGLRQARKEDRRIQTERLNDLVPRAEAGTRDRQLEKKRELADSTRAFAAGKDAAGDVDLPDSDVLGDEDSLGSLRRMQKEAERKRSDREIRREEVLRARIAEREERMKGMKEKEDKTMESLKEIARRRFGAQV